ncbi:MAG: hypothetical protein HYU67_05645 [Flavobacteriia bacterium]|nr:hypothetical protein [Flavobacteriia bacterium]
MKLIIESGSTKSDALLIAEKTRHLFQFEGINPVLENEQSILLKLESNQLLQKHKQEINKVYFFGAGCSGVSERKKLKKSLSLFFENMNLCKIETDLYACAYACYDSKPIIACILGTGSNSCYFDGKKIIEKSSSLGYILGDEGSASNLGKKLIKQYFYNKLPHELNEKFKKKYKLNKKKLIEKVYQQDKANLFLASFSKFLYENKEHSFVQKLIEESFNEFIENHILVYEESKNSPICFVGSVAFYFQETLLKCLKTYSLNVGIIIQKPLENLYNKI